MSGFAAVADEIKYLRRVNGIATRFCEVGIRLCRSGPRRAGINMAIHAEKSAMQHAKEDCEAFDQALGVR